MNKVFSVIFSILLLAISCEAFAYTVCDARGVLFEFEKTPRCATVVPAVSQNIFALGAEENLIANSRFCNIPKEAKLKIKIGGFIDPDYEKILEIKPDVVILPTTKESRIEKRLEKLGIKSFVLHSEGIKYISADIRMLGKLLQKEALANKIADEFDSIISTKFDAGKNRRAIFMFGKMAGGKGSFAGDILSACGLKNCAEKIGVPWAEVSKEFVLTALPEVIFVEVANDSARIQAEKFYKTDPIWRTTPAVKNNAIYFIPRNLVIVPSVRVVEAVKLMRSYLSKNK